MDNSENVYAIFTGDENNACAETAEGEWSIVTEENDLFTQKNVKDKPSEFENIGLYLYDEILEDPLFCRLMTKGEALIQAISGRESLSEVIEKIKKQKDIIKKLSSIGYNYNFCKFGYLEYYVPLKPYKTQLVEKYIKESSGKIIPKYKVFYNHDGNSGIYTTNGKVLCRIINSIGELEETLESKAPELLKKEGLFTYEEMKEMKFDKLLFKSVFYFNFFDNAESFKKIQKHFQKHLEELTHLHQTGWEICKSESEFFLFKSPAKEYLRK